MRRVALPHDSFAGTILAGLALIAVLTVAAPGLAVGLSGLDPLDGVARIVHILAVVLWMGHNYANVVANPRFKGLPPSAPPAAADAVFLAASKREHAMFRYPSLVVWATGVYMLWNRGLLADAFLLRDPAQVIGIGAWLGSLMVLNLWLVMWPHQKKVLGFVPASIPERLRCARVTFLSSRTNTILSLATVVFMVAGAHGSPFGG